jgi:hypothetical protein
MDRPRTIHPDREKLTIRHTNPFLPSDYSTQTSFFFLSSEEAQARNIVGKSLLVLSMHFVLQQFMRWSAVTMRHTYTYGVVTNPFPSFCSLGCLFSLTSFLPFRLHTYITASCFMVVCIDGMHARMLLAIFEHHIPFITSKAEGSSTIDVGDH